MLLKDQMINSRKEHDEALASSYEIEISRLVDTIEKKEFTL
jgi:hypothetical protein